MSEIETNDAGLGGTRRYADVSDRIATLLNDAEATADQIREEAERDAERIVREAEERGRARVEELTGVPERLRAEAEEYSRDTRSAADDYAAETRDSADEHARLTTAEAQRQADAMRAAAEELVRQIEAAGQARQAELREQTRQLEEGRDQVVAGLSRTLKGLRKTSTQLEQIIVDAVPTAAAAVEPERPRFGFRRRREETVYEALKPAADTMNGTGARDDLYERAKELGVRGRSRMSRDELEAAVEALEREE